MVFTGLTVKVDRMQTEIHGHKQIPRRLPRVGALLLLGVLGLLLAACSSGSASTTSTTSKSSAASKKTTSSSFTAYRNCLSQHGVTLPNFSRGNHGTGASPGTGGFTGGTAPSGAGGGFRGAANNPKFAAAEKACASLRPKGGFGGGFGGRGGVSSTAFAAYRNCLKLHGVTLPTRGTSSNSPPSTADTSSAAYQAAAAACASLRPTPPSTPSSTG
jgi:hypothetical protein